MYTIYEHMYSVQYSEEKNNIIPRNTVPFIISLIPPVPSSNCISLNAQNKKADQKRVRC